MKNNHKIIISLLLFINISCSNKHSNSTEKTMTNTSKSINIPKSIKEKLALIDKYSLDKTSKAYELKEIITGEKYMLYVKDKTNNEGYSIEYIFNNLDNDNVWKFQTPETGSGSNVTKGVIMFTENGLIEMSTFSSCSGAFDCKEYITVKRNGKVIYEKKRDVSN
jgi:hypothetical protein